MKFGVKVDIEICEANVVTVRIDTLNTFLHALLK
jgi:hypothetical protein